MSRTADQIAADRARYEEHQRKGLDFAPRALPEPSALPPPPIAAPLHVETIPGGWYWGTQLRKGEALRIHQSEGGGTVSLVAWSAADPSERLNLPDTVKVQWNTRVQKGRVLFSDMGRVLLSIIEDSTGGAHDVLMGPSTAVGNAARYPGSTRNSRDNLVLVAGKFGLSRRDIPMALGLFAPVRVQPDGRMAWQSDLLHGGDYVALQAEMDLLVGLSNCPHPLDPAPNYAPPAVTVTRYRPPDDAADLCRTASAEAVRGFENNARAEV